MKARLIRGACLAAIAAVALPAFTSAAIPSGGGQERPESILPPGFGEPAAQPSARPTAAAPRTPAPGAAPAGSATPAPGPGSGMVQPLPTATPTPLASATPTPEATIDPAVLAQ